MHGKKKDHSSQCLQVTSFDSIEEPAEQGIKTSIQKSIKDMLSTDREETSLEKEEEPVVQAQLEPKKELPKTNAEKVREARKQYTPISERTFDKNLYLEALIATSFFKAQIANFRISTHGDKKARTPWVKMKYQSSH